METGATTKVLVLVEEDAALRELLTDVLSEVSGYRVVAVRDAAQARAVLQRERPDGILLDGDLRGVAGAAQFYDHLQADPATHAIPVLVLTTTPTDARLRVRGVPHVLAKPFTLDALLQRVAALLAAPPR